MVYCMSMYCDSRASDVTKACVLPRWLAGRPGRMGQDDGRMAGWQVGERASHWSAVGNRSMYQTCIRMCVYIYVRAYMAFDVYAAAPGAPDGICGETNVVIGGCVSFPSCSVEISSPLCQAATFQRSGTPCALRSMHRDR